MNGKRSFRVLVTDAPWGDIELEQEFLAALPAQVALANGTTETALVEAARDCDAIAACWAKVTARVMETAPRCRIIARMGIGLDNIDLDAARANGMLVTNVPDYCVEEVAEHTLALLLALSRRVAFLHLRTKQGEYDLQQAGPLRRLSRQTLGLIGLGRIGGAVARRATALGMHVVAYTPSGDARGTGCEMLSLDALLHESDFISLHAPLTDESRHTINAEALTKMRPTACLINTSRGGLIDYAALAEALAADRLGGAALDVFDPEPPDLSQPLYRDERVIVTPHAAFLSEESLRELRTRVTAQISAALRGERPQNVVVG